MANNMWTVLMRVIFPLTHLEMYLTTCSQIEFERRLSPRMQNKERMFSPYHYRDPFVRDCVIELKERGNRYVARLFGKKIGQWIAKTISDIRKTDPDASCYLVPIPQHQAKTKEKGFEHALILAQSVAHSMPHTLCPDILPCLEKYKKTKRLHDLKGRSSRFRTIGHTMRAHLTRHDAHNGYFFVIDDVYTTGATFKEARRSLTDCGALPERMFFVSIAH